MKNWNGLGWRSYCFCVTHNVKWSRLYSECECYPPYLLLRSSVVSFGKANHSWLFMKRIYTFRSYQHPIGGQVVNAITFNTVLDFAKTFFSPFSNCHTEASWYFQRGTRRPLHWRGSAAPFELAKIWAYFTWRVMVLSISNGKPTLFSLTNDLSTNPPTWTYSLYFQLVQHRKDQAGGRARALHPTQK